MPYGPPEQIKPKALGDYLEVMSKGTFQSGMSWAVVEAKWPGIRAAFKDFEIDAVAEMTDDEIDALTNDTAVIRNRRKLAAVVTNAQRLIALEGEHGSFKKYLESAGDFESTLKSLRKNFKFMGDFGGYLFLYVIGQPVPDHDEFRASRDK